MDMRRSKAVACVDCGGQAADVGQLSYRGLCAACGTARAVAAWSAMVGRHGAQYERWLASAGPRGRPPK